MWTMLAQLLYRSLLRDDLGIGTRITPPALTNLRATSTAVTDYYKKQQAGGVTDELKSEASKDLLALSGDRHLSTSELAQVRAIQGKIDAGKPLTEGDVKQVGTIVDHLEAQLQEVEKARSHYQVGREQIDKGNYREAEAEFRQAIAACPPDEKEHLGNLHADLAEALKSQGKQAEYLQENHIALELNPKAAWAGEVREELLKASSRQFDKGNALYDAGHFAEAEAEWRKAIAVCPNDETEHQANLQQDLGKALQRQGKGAEAIAAFQRSLELSPNGKFSKDAQESIQDLQNPTVEKSKAHFNEGRAQLDRGKNLEAESEFRQSLAACPPDDTDHPGVVHANIGLALEQQDRMDDAVSEYQEALKQDPETELADDVRQKLQGQSKLHEDLATVQVLQKQYPEAEKELRKAIAACPPNDTERQGKLQYSLGQVLQKEGKNEEAGAAYRQSLQLSPGGPAKQLAEQGIKELEGPSAEQANAHLEAGKAAYLQGRFKESESEIRQALTFCPPDNTELRAALHKDLGLALEGQGRRAEALPEYKEFLKINPQGLGHELLRDELLKESRGHFEKGSGLYDKSQYAEAEEEYRKAIAICPDDETEHQANLQYDLGTALQKEGKKEEAIAAYQRSLELSPNGKFSKDARQGIQEQQ